MNQIFRNRIWLVPNRCKNVKFFASILNETFYFIDGSQSMKINVLTHIFSLLVDQFFALLLTYERFSILYWISAIEQILILSITYFVYSHNAYYEKNYIKLVKLASFGAKSWIKTPFFVMNFTFRILSFISFQTIILFIFCVNLFLNSQNDHIFAYNNFLSGLMLQII
jgi:hypothetical protein